MSATGPFPRRSKGRAVPVGLNEAALDSPTFRASTTHFSKQIDALEKWLSGYVSSTSKLVHDMLALEETVNAYLIKTIPCPADGIIENDYTFLALKRVADGQRECWTQTLSSLKKLDGTVVEPIRSFLSGDMRNFKETRRVLEQAQRAYDATLARYVSQFKTKEPSALREDAFSVWESRKAYMQASMDYSQLAPQLRFTTDMLLVKISNDIWNEMKGSRDAWNNATRWVREMDRVRGWAKEMEQCENVFKRELQMSRKQLGENTYEELKPSRELEDYNTSTVPYLGSRGLLNMRTRSASADISDKQGWLFLRMMSGKPVRYTWARRWYYCRGGVFGWLIPGAQGVLQGDEIGVLLCNAKPAAGEERRFCFEVKTKNQTMMLQTETQKELMEWLEVFEVTKKKAFEASMSRDSKFTTGTDPAFLISPPSFPEFSARAFDSQMSASDEQGTGLERSMTLAPGTEVHSDTRQSFDVNGGLGRRSFTALGRDLATREDGESGRDHAARIIQKLDLHRKSTFSTAMDPSPTAPANAAGGIVSLLSASHNLLPVHPSNLAPTSTRQTAGMRRSLDSTPNSLAPLTLAKPPAMTSLSRTAVLVTGERTFMANGRKLPTSIVANYWGSNVWSTSKAREEPVLPRRDDDDPFGVVMSDSSSVTLPKKTEKGTDCPMPANYPAELRAQNAQFQLLFPNAPVGERLVLVFRASWWSSVEHDSQGEAQAGEGRVYVTPDNIYFYSQQMGLVTAFSIHLDIITEVTSTAGNDSDTIILHLGQDTNETGYTRISIKVFLDDLKLLRTRLNLLVDNLQAEEPLDTENIISALIQADADDYEGRPSPDAESWEEISPSIPADDEAPSGQSVARHHHQHTHHAHTRPHRGHPRVPPKLHLPSHPVVYEPEGMAEKAAERHFEISAKACFHLLFGDKSFVFPKLYFEHRAQQIAQGPWTLVDQGRMRREFQFKVDYVDLLGRSKSAKVNDFQTIDVYSDHATYVVTHNKTAWHLPHSRSFKVVSKIVITYAAKSKCKLAVYTVIEWSKAPALSKNLVERQALHDAREDAEELAEMATDQVRKLGARSRTNRAIHVYGQVGQQTQVVVFSPAATEASKKQAIKPRTLTAMLLETVRSLAESAVSSLIMWAFAGVRKLFDVISAQRVILALLALSILSNVLLTSTESSTWWRERRAARMMQRMGVGPNLMMSKAVYVADLDEASGLASQAPWATLNGTCWTTYKKLLDATDLDAPWGEAGATLTWSWSRVTARRLRRTRQRLASYRHDLLVAMRVVNSVEREMVQSEWENWLMSEQALCDNLDLVLKGRNGKDAAKGPREPTLLDSLGSRQMEEVRTWSERHCGSCRHELAGVLRERGKMSRR